MPWLQLICGVHRRAATPYYSYSAYGPFQSPGEPYYVVPPLLLVPRCNVGGGDDPLTALRAALDAQNPHRHSPT